jgi:hypothetical protein
MDFLESAKERDASEKEEFVKPDLLAMLTFAISKNDPPMRFMNAIAD